ncbi:MAG: hypothetical protein WAO71_03575 [Gallionella sp.]
MGREESERAGVSISQKPSYRGGGLGFGNGFGNPNRFRISAFVPGEGSRINRIYIKAAGVEVTELAPGQEFKVYVDFNAYNGAGGLAAHWSATVTVVDLESGQIRNWNRAGGQTSVFNPDGSIQKVFALDKMGSNVMPDHDVSLRVKVWGHDAGIPTPETPAYELW